MILSQAFMGTVLKFLGSQKQKDAFDVEINALNTSGYYTYRQF